MAQCLVRVEVVDPDCAKRDEYSYYYHLSVAEFGRYMVLLSRLVELVEVWCQMMNHVKHRGERSNRKLCSICYHHSPDSILSCGHDLCEDCERQWVHRQRSCPFCRQYARSQKLRGWQLLDHPDDDVSATTLRKDMVQLQYQLAMIRGVRQKQVEEQDHFVPLVSCLNMAFIVVDTDDDETDGEDTRKEEDIGKFIHVVCT